ncbi:3'(2'),5'-bisphosphate nucleotidase CysQ [uncultured Kordia sp.]|uniref:3'(2'),5'-bisphosphate nucleotidase CysQ n=1 Tax=uncultured Kordia sp. TaxID=507699 RepID=UPI00260B312A|nr:3'(2'),5'-bisphosphate nucleotidase CysQ [uncultured Kordia sp.]
MNKNEELEIAIQAALDAGSEIMKIYEKVDLEVEIKSDNSPLTIADKTANTVINGYLKNTSIPIISEENKVISFEERKNWNQCWIVDPLDGTKEFIKRNGEFTVNIALIENGKPKIGVIYAPVKKDLYYAVVEENKAFKASVEEHNTSLKEVFDIAKEIAPSKEEETIKVVGSRSHMNQETQDFISQLKEKHPEATVEVISKGSSLKFCLVAEGEAHYYPRYAPTMEWDTAAGQAICEAVNLEVISQATNAPLLYNRENLLNSWFLVAKN